MSSPGPSSSRLSSGHRRALRWLAPPLALLAGIAVYDLARQPAPPTYETVRRPSALDGVPAPTVDGAATRPCAGRPERWIVVGWDGASWDLILPLLADGRLPHLAALIDNGASGDLYGFQPSLSPVLWTTVATGVSPARHGILGFDKRKHRLLRRLERVTHLGHIRRELYSNADRRAPAIWNLLSDAGRPTLVVGYHNTYPAEPVQGAMISNYVIRAYLKQVMRANARPPEDFLETVVYPPTLLPEVLDLERAVEQELAPAVARFADYDAEQRAEFAVRSRSLGAAGDTRMYYLRQAFLFDAFHGEAALRWYPELQPDLALVHFQAADLASHYFLYFHEPQRFEAMGWSAATRAELDRELPAYRKTVTAFYVWLDEWLGRLLELRDERTAVMVLSDHGFEPEPDPGRSGHHNEAPPGILVAEGPGIRAGMRLEGATLYDVLPTLVAGLELPLAADLDGRVLEELYCTDTWSELRHTTVASYGPYRPLLAPPPPPEFADEIERELRALGYID